MFFFFGDARKRETAKTGVVSSTVFFSASLGLIQQNRNLNPQVLAKVPKQTRRYRGTVQNYVYIYMYIIYMYIIYMYIIYILYIYYIYYIYIYYMYVCIIQILIMAHVRSRTPSLKGRGLVCRAVTNCWANCHQDVVGRVLMLYNVPQTTGGPWNSLKHF